MTKRILVRIHGFLSAQLGINLGRFLRSLRGLPHFLRDLRHFRRQFSGRLLLAPCLHDRYEEGGVTKDEYFWQDLLVARWIYEASPTRHIDVGSRIDGFVAHVASFREIEVFDVRAITTQVPGIVFRQADLMDSTSVTEYAGETGCCDSLSCLHALEHFGLGRYGDPLDPQGFQRGLENMARLLRVNGTFYLSTPVGKERVEFNANWVFNPKTIVRIAKENGLSLEKLTIIVAGKDPCEIIGDEDELTALSREHYQLGIFVFRKEQGPG